MTAPGVALYSVWMDITLIGDSKVREIRVIESGNPFVDLAARFSELTFDFERKHVQKKSKSILWGREEIGHMLLKAQENLPLGLKLLIKECYRPLSIQREFFDEYSAHMGTEFNADPLQTEYATFTRASNIHSQAKENRALLIDVMEKAGFINYPTEWWHWSYGDKYWAFMTGASHALYSSQEEIS